jgi:hypothetical protein
MVGQVAQAIQGLGDVDHRIAIMVRVYIMRGSIALTLGPALPKRAEGEAEVSAEMQKQCRTCGPNLDWLSFERCLEALGLVVQKWATFRFKQWSQGNWRLHWSDCQPKPRGKEPTSVVAL